MSYPENWEKDSKEQPEFIPEDYLVTEPVIGVKYHLIWASSAAMVWVFKGLSVHGAAIMETPKTKKQILSKVNALREINANAIIKRNTRVYAEKKAEKEKQRAIMLEGMSEYITNETLKTKAIMITEEKTIPQVEEETQYVKSRWTAAEIDIILEAYKVNKDLVTLTNDMIAKMPYRTPVTMRQRIYDITEEVRAIDKLRAKRLRDGRTTFVFTQEELDEYCREQYLFGLIPTKSSMPKHISQGNILDEEDVPAKDEIKFIPVTEKENQLKPISSTNKVSYFDDVLLVKSGTVLVNFAGETTCDFHIKGTFDIVRIEEQK